MIEDLHANTSKNTYEHSTREISANYKILHYKLYLRLLFWRELITAHTHTEQRAKFKYEFKHLIQITR